MTSWFSRALQCAGVGILVVSAAGTLIYEIPSARAADAPPPVALGVIDLRGVVMESSAGASVMKQRDAFRNALKSSVAKEETSLREAGQELERSRTIVSAEAFAEKQRTLGMRIAETQRSVDIRRRSIDYSAGEGMEVIEKKVLEISAQIAKERNMNMVLHATQTVFFDGKFDISKVTLDKLNKDMPSVTLRDPAVIVNEAKARQNSANGKPAGK